MKSTLHTTQLFKVSASSLLKAQVNAPYGTFHASITVRIRLKQNAGHVGLGCNMCLETMFYECDTGPGKQKAISDKLISPNNVNDSRQRRCVEHMRSFTQPFHLALSSQLCFSNTTFYRHRLKRAEAESKSYLHSREIVLAIPSDTGQTTTSC